MKETKDLLYSLPLHHFKSYFELSNWTLVNENDRWIVYEDKDAIELAIPKNRQASDYGFNLNHFLKTLSFALDKEPEIVAEDILSFNLNVFVAAFEHATDITSITIRHADTVLTELRRLFTYAVSSEIDAKPYFRAAPSKANVYLDSFHFGHTIKGSFGYRIESKIRYASRKQLTYLDEKAKIVSQLEQKAMERVIKGLATTDQAARSGDVSVLVEGYTDGLNGNMCTALLNLYEETRDEIEYSIKWAKRVTLPDDLREFRRVSIGHDHIYYLEEASEHLYRQDPQHTDIVGYVTDLSHRNGPDRHELGAGAITIQRLTPEGRSQKVYVEVDKQAHSEAVEAYRTSRAVGVKGKLGYGRSKWRLSNPEHFRIIT